MTDVTGFGDMTEGNHDIGLAYTFNRKHNIRALRGLNIGMLYTKMKIRSWIDETGVPDHLKIGYNLEAPGSILFHVAYRFGTGKKKKRVYSFGVTPEIGGGPTIAALRANSIPSEDVKIQHVGWNVGFNLKFDVSVRHFSFYVRAHTRQYWIGSQTIPAGKMEGINYGVAMITYGMTYNLHIGKGLKTRNNKLEYNREYNRE